MKQCLGTVIPTHSCDYLQIGYFSHNVRQTIGAALADETAASNGRSTNVRPFAPVIYANKIQYVKKIFPCNSVPFGCADVID